SLGDTLCESIRLSTQFRIEVSMPRRFSQDSHHHRAGSRTAIEICRSKLEITPHCVEWITPRIDDRGYECFTLRKHDIAVKQLACLLDCGRISGLDDPGHGLIDGDVALGHAVYSPRKGLAHAGGFKPGIHDIGETRHTVRRAENLVVDRLPIGRNSKILRQ